MIKKSAWPCMPASDSELALDPLPDFIADPPKFRHLIFIRTSRMERIIKRPLPSFYVCRKHRAVFISRGTDTNDNVGRRSLRWKEITNRLADLTGNINSTFRHDCHGTRMHVARRFRTRRQRFKAFSVQMPKETFRHLTATGVSRAEKKNTFTSRHKPDTVQSPAD